MAVFSDRFSEGALKNLRDGFPSDEEPHTDSYEYLSDSDLDEAEDYEAEDYAEAPGSLSDDAATSNSAHEKRPGVSYQESSQARGVPSPTVNRGGDEQATSVAEDLGGRLGTAHIQTGKMAIIRDMAATT